MSRSSFLFVLLRGSLASAVFCTLVGITTDARGNDWIRAWHACCGRFQGSRDPLGHGTISNTDYYGNVTHTAVVKTLPLPDTNTGVLPGSFDPHDPPAGTDPLDPETLNETTTRYDARHRPIATTRWLVARGPIDQNNVPIAGGGKPGDPAIVIAGVTQGLTTQYFYDEDLTDGDLTVQKLGGGTYTVSIADLITKLEEDANADASLGDFFAAGSDGSARVTINPEEEISVSIQDSLGRTVCQGILDPTDQETPITWSTTHYDAMKPVARFRRLS